MIYTQFRGHAPNAVSGSNHSGRVVTWYGLSKAGATVSWYGVGVSRSDEDAIRR